VAFDLVRPRGRQGVEGVIKQALVALTTCVHGFITSSRRLRAE
jgi:hypothetical protein